MKQILLTALLCSFAIAAAGQGSVIMGNTAATTFQTNSLAVGGNGNGNAVAAGGPYYYEVLVAPSTVTYVDSDLQQLLSGVWSDTGLRGTNLGFAGRENSGGMTTVSNWPVDGTNSFIIVGWSAKEGASWSEVATRLAGAQLYGSAGALAWAGGGLVPGGFLGATTIGFRLSGGVIGSTTYPTLDLFGSAADSYGQPITSTTTLWVVPGSLPPVITSQPVDQVVFLGSNATFSVYAQYGSAYQWSFNAIAIPGATGSPLVITNAQFSQAGSYSAAVTNVYGSATSQAAILQVLPYGAPGIQVNGRPAVGTIQVTAPPLLTISGGFANGFIFYTLDGSTPTTSSPLYSEAITLTNSVTVQAMSLSADFSQTSYAPSIPVQIIPAYALQTSLIGSGSITVNPSTGPYASNSTVTLTATASPGWWFAHWAGDLAGSQNPISLLMNGPHSVQAVFVQTAFPLTLSSPGGGYVAANGQSIPPATLYPTGSVVTLQAWPSNGWSFLGWQGDAVGTNNPLSIMIGQTNIIQGVFGTTVSTNILGSGNVIFDQTNPVPYGTLLNASAVSSPGSYFRLWSGAVSGTSTAASFVVVNATPTVGALFAAVPAGTCTLNVVVNGHGTVTVNPQQPYYSIGDTVTLTATPTNASFSFFGWSQDAPGNANPLSLLMTTNKVAEADFGSLPSVTVSPTNQTVVLGNSAVLYANALGLPPLTYQWLKGAGAIPNATNATLTITNAQTGDAGSYSVVVSNPYGSVTSGLASVTVVLPPGITQSPSNVTVSAGTLLTLNVSASGTAPLFYQWYNSSGAIVGATNSAYTLNPVQTNNADAYVVLVYNPYGSATSEVAVVTVYVPVNITLEPVGQVLPAKAHATFTVAASGYPAPAYQWLLNGTNLPGATFSTLTIPHVQLSDLGDYSLLAGNGYSSQLSTVATLRMSPSILGPFVGVTGIWGESAVLSVGAIGSGTLTYQWFKGGVAIPSATNDNYRIPTLQLTDAGLYSVVVGSEFGMVTNQAAQLIVNPANVSLGTFAGVIIQGVAGYTYSIQYSTNLTDTNAWTSLTNLTLQQPVEIWSDYGIDVRSSPKRFYRVEAVP